MSKVLLVSGSLPPIDCGVGFYTARLSRELAAAGLEVELLSTAGVDTDTAAPLMTVPNWKITSLPKMMKVIKQSQAGIIHIEYPAVGYHRQLGINLIPYALRLFRPKLKILITLHEYNQSRLIGRIRNLITIWPAHRIIVSNQLDKNRLGRKAVIVPIGANFDTVARRPEIYTELMRRHKLDAHGRTIVFFGYAHPAKRLEALLSAMEVPGLLDYQLLIFPALEDKTNYHRSLKSKIAEINRRKPRIAVEDFLKDEAASAVLQECQYFVMPANQSLTAKSGTAIAAIENDLVVIAKKAEQPGDNLPYVHGENCYLLDEISPKSIAETIGRLDAAPAELNAIRRGAAELKKYFSWNNIIKQHMKIYKEVSNV